MLVSVAQYELITGDTTSAASAVSASLLEAEELLGEALYRTLPSGERTETLIVRAHGRVYPKAVPVTAIATASESAGTIEYEGHAVKLTSAPLVMDMIANDFQTGLYDDTDVSTAALTYTGGYTSTTLPARLRRALAVIAKALRGAPSDGGLGTRPEAVTSVSLGDASMSFDRASVAASAAGAMIDNLVPGLMRMVSGYTRREP